MIFAVDVLDNSVVMDARKEAARDLGTCIYCDKPVYLGDGRNLRDWGGPSYCHENKRDELACLKSRSRFPR